MATLSLGRISPEIRSGAFCIAGRLAEGEGARNAKSKNKLAQCKSDVIVYEWFIEARAGSTSASTDNGATRYTHRR